MLPLKIKYSNPQTPPGPKQHQVLWTFWVVVLGKGLVVRLEKGVIKLPGLHNQPDRTG
jgi:hypothetical protein